MADEDTLKLWIKEQFEDQYSKLATREQVGAIGLNVNKNTELIKKNTESIQAQKRELDGLHGSMRTIEMEHNEMKRGFDQRVRRVLDAGAGSGVRGGTNTRQNTLQNDAEAKAFEEARRSLRIWPLQGESKEEILDSVTAFCHDALLIGRSVDLGIKSVDRVRSAPRGVAYMEILVQFVDNYSRDRVFACGPKLSGYRDSANKPTCGIRLHIPGHLMSHFKLLESFAGTLRSMHNGEIKKYIKFDELNRSLFIQIKHDRDREWMDFTVEQARMEKDRLNSKRTKKSLLFLSPEIVGEVNEEEETGTKRKRNEFPGRRQGAFVPPPRTSSGTSSQASSSGTTRKNLGSWRPPTNEERDDQDESM